MSAFSGHELHALSALNRPAQVLTVRVGHCRYGIDINCLREIRPWERPAADGCVTVRGERIPVVDLREMLTTAVTINADTVTVVLLHDDASFGLTVDKVDDVFELPPSALRESLSLRQHLRNAHALGIAQLDDGDLPVLLLDVRSVRPKAGT